MDSFTPSGLHEPDTTPEAALILLQSCLHIDFAPTYVDNADRRHELAVLAVDLGRRMADLRKHLVGNVERDRLVLDRLAQVCRDGEDLSTDRPENVMTGDVLALHARVAELDRTLRVLAVAYKQAWWADAVPADALPDAQERAHQRGFGPR